MFYVVISKGKKLWNSISHKYKNLQPAAVLPLDNIIHKKNFAKKITEDDNSKVHTHISQKGPAK